MSNANQCRWKVAFSTINDIYASTYYVTRRRSGSAYIHQVTLSTSKQKLFNFTFAWKAILHIYIFAWLLSLWQHNVTTSPPQRHQHLVYTQHVTHTTVLRLSGFCLEQPRWAHNRRNIQPLTPIVAISHPLSASSIYYNPWHPPCSIDVHAWQSFSTISLQVFFGLPLGLAPSTSYSIVGQPSPQNMSKKS